MPAGVKKVFPEETAFMVRPGGQEGIKQVKGVEGGEECFRKWEQYVLRVKGRLGGGGKNGEHMKLERLLGAGSEP